MMTEKQLIERLLELQEHPGQATDQELQQALDDPQMRELVEQMAFAKRAFKHEELQGQECDVEEEWNKFAAQHFDEESDVKQQHQTSNYHGLNTIFNHRFSIFNRPKVASFIGLLVVSGIAFAAIHFVRWHSDEAGDVKSPRQETPMTPQQQTAPTDTFRTDTAITATQDAAVQPVVFDNVRLDEMLPHIASFYHAEVAFENESARELRFHFVWKQEDGLQHAIEKLNRFESLTIRLENNTIIVE